MATDNGELAGMLFLIITILGVIFIYLYEIAKHLGVFE